MTAILSVCNLVKRFGGLTATDDVNLALLSGEIHAVIGPNGAGKTTLINQLTGEIRPDSGTIRLEYSARRPEQNTRLFIATHSLPQRSRRRRGI
jgi:ABC-type branched-subunit amino acid transport system ATPase component